MASPSPITTARLTLLPTEPSEFMVKATYTLHTDKLFAQWSIRGVATSVEDARQRLQAMLTTTEGAISTRAWLIFETPPAGSSELDPSAVCGSVTLLPGARVGGDRGAVWELGYGFRPDFWGKGYATEAIRAAIQDLAREIDAGIVSLERAPKVHGGDEKSPSDIMDFKVGVARRPKQTPMAGSAATASAHASQKGDSPAKDKPKETVIVGIVGKGQVAEAEWKDGMWKLMAWVSPAHKGSLRVLEKMGLTNGLSKDFGGDDWFLGGDWRADGVWELERVFQKGEKIVWS